VCGVPAPGPAPTLSCTILVIQICRPRFCRRHASDHPTTGALIGRSSAPAGAPTGPTHWCPRPTVTLTGRPPVPVSTVPLPASILHSATTRQRPDPHPPPRLHRADVGPPHSATTGLHPPRTAPTAGDRRHLSSTAPSPSELLASRRGRPSSRSTTTTA
jgi:hypothetical protein